MKYIFVIVVAVLIDTFQMLIALSLAGIVFAAGAAVAWIPFLGVAAAGGLSLTGVVLGAIMDFCISVTFGSGLIFLLISDGLLSWREIMSVRRMPLIAVKYIPIVNFLPFYTALAAVCVLKKLAEEKAGGLVGAAVAVATAGPSRVSRLAAALRERQAEQTPERNGSGGQEQEERKEARPGAQARQPLQDIRPRVPLTLAQPVR